MKMENFWQTPVKFLKGVGPARAELLAKETGIRTFSDLLYFFPHKYVDRSRIYPINQLDFAPAEVQVKGKFTAFVEKQGPRGKRLTGYFEDETGMLEVVWFSRYKWVKNTYKIGEEYILYGKINRVGGRFSMPHPEVEKAEEFQAKSHGGLFPVYPSGEKMLQKGITRKVMRHIMQELFGKIPAGSMTETLPPEILRRLNLMSREEALRQIHFPDNLRKLSAAQYRLKFEELFFLQLQLARKRLLRKKNIQGIVLASVGPLFHKFYHEVLPFDLTEAQKRVIREIRRDVKSGYQMNRLLQGDVGSGKTVVAMMAMLMALDNGYQAALLAPTSILARQHYENLKKWAEPLGLHVDLLTGATGTRQRREIHAGLQNGSTHILVGTHAILEENVKFKNLALAVIDEQHRFGVAQRAKMWLKNTPPPHVLIMTATPIPRTLALTHYGDLDVSVIDELPPGRKPVKTYHIYEKDRQKLYEFLKRQIHAGRQAYVVFPLIEESKNSDYRNVTEGYERFKRVFGPSGIRVGMVHGGMKPADKNNVMDAFKNGEIDILVSTTVIEVGVDVPNATVMIIESAERFGLAQLHQLRGRVGRGAHGSYCFLVTGNRLSDDAKARMKAMVTTSDGFKIAETDLRLRGPGDIMGTQQSGIIKLKLADYVKDAPLMLTARKEAQNLLRRDPALQLPEHRVVRKVLQENFRHKSFWNYIG